LDREMKLRKEIQDCKLQKEYLTQLLADLSDEDPQREEQ